MQARLQDSENRVMGTSFLGKSKKQNSGTTQIKIEQQENEIAHLKDVFTISQKNSEKRHQELLDKMLKMHQDIFTQQKVSTAYTRPTSNPVGSTSTQQTMYQPRNARDVDGIIRDLMCWFCGENGHMSGRCLVRQRYIDEGKIILRGSTVCLPNGQSIYYSQGKDFQKIQVDKAMKDTQQNNMLLTEEDFAGTPVEEVEAYLATLKERKRMSQLIQQLRFNVYDDEEENVGLRSVNIQTRSQKSRNDEENSNAKQGF